MYSSFPLYCLKREFMIIKIQSYNLVFGQPTHPHVARCVLYNSLCLDFLIFVIAYPVIVESAWNLLHAKYFNSLCLKETAEYWQSVHHCSFNAFMFTYIKIWQQVVSNDVMHIVSRHLASYLSFHFWMVQMRLVYLLVFDYTSCISQIVDNAKLCLQFMVCFLF